MVAAHGDRFQRIGKINDVRVATRGLRDATLRRLPVRSGEGILRALPRLAATIHLLVADKEVHLARRLLVIREDLVTRVHLIDADQFWLLDRPAVLTVADVDGHCAGTTLRRVCDPVVYPEVVDARVRVPVLTHILRLVDVLHVDDDVLGTAGNREQVVVRGECVVHPAIQFLIERRRDFRMRRIGEIEDHHAVHPVRRALAGEYAVPPVRRHGHVVDRARIDLDRIGLDDVVQVRDVEDDGVSVTAPRPDEAVVAAILGRPRPEIRRVRRVDVAAARDRDALAHIARRHLNRLLRARTAGRSHQRVAARIVARETAELHDARAAGDAVRGDRIVRRVSVGPGDRRITDDAAVRLLGVRREVDNVACADLVILHRDLKL